MGCTCVCVCVRLSGHDVIMASIKSRSEMSICNNRPWMVSRERDGARSGGQVLLGPTVRKSFPHIQRIILKAFE